ncbi:MAG: glucosaminidase domain-containing protein [Pseudomonadota bacterium]
MTTRTPKPRVKGKPASAPRTTLRRQEPKTENTKKAAIADSKQAFLDKLTPIVQRENRRLETLRAGVISLVSRLERNAALSDAEESRLRELAERYRVKGDPVTEAKARDELVEKVDIIPVGLTLAQAVNESAWGKSRFAREGLNLFGIWTYDPDKGIVPKSRAKGKKHLVRKFDSLDESVRYYMENLNSHPAYASLRKIRREQRAAGESLDSLPLAEGLEKYSAKGKVYVELIQGIIKRYDLAAIDDNVTRG